MRRHEGGAEDSQVFPALPVPFPRYWGEREGSGPYSPLAAPLAAWLRVHRPARRVARRLTPVPVAPTVDSECAQLRCARYPSDPGARGRVLISRCGSCTSTSDEEKEAAEGGTRVADVWLTPPCTGRVLLQHYIGDAC
ncbi:hypothetical protein MRX96_031424 [Rhipicephalus microplus]